MSETLHPDTAAPISQQIARVRASIADDPLLSHLYSRMIATLDISKNARLIEQYGTNVGFSGALKYLDCAYWLQHKLAHAIELGLHKRRGLQILDLGTGGGHFAFVCNWLGHSVLGVDLHEDIYTDICGLLGVTRIEHRIGRRSPLPQFGRRFDLVTAFASQFDVMPGPTFWSRDDWRWFIDHLIRDHLAVPGRIYLTPNSMWDAEARDWKPKLYVAEVFCEYGGYGDGIVVGLDVDDDTLALVAGRDRGSAIPPAAPREERPGR